MKLEATQCVRGVVGAATTLLALSLNATAQIHTWDGSGPNDLFGFSVDGIGDVDGDGFDDVIVGGPHIFEIAGFAPSYARVFSGQSGALLFEDADPQWDDHRGHTVRGVGDFNGDGTPDFMVCSEPDACFGFDVGHARIYSGANGQLLADPEVSNWFDFDEQSADGAGDVNGDGFADVILGEPESLLQNRGRAHVYAGPDGTFVRTFEGSAAGELFGLYVAGVGDWNNDRSDDVAITGTVETNVYSAVDGALLFTTPWTGWVGDPGDFDGDGSRDLLVHDRVVSGADGSTLLQLSGWTNYRVGADMDCDGLLDFLAADTSFNGGRGRIAALAGVDGSVIAILAEGTVAGGHLGADLALAGDVNGDGVPDVVAGQPDAGAGTAFAFSGVSVPPSNFCVGAPNSAGPGGAVMGYSGSWSITNNDFVLRVGACPPVSFGVFFYGPTQIQVPFGNGFACVGGGVTRLQPPIQTNAQGAATRATDFDAPPMNGGPNPVIGGSTYSFQFWYRDVPAGGAFFNLSDGLEVTFCR